MHAGPGYKFKAAEKRELVVATLHAQDSHELLPLKEIALFAGASISFRPSLKMAALEKGGLKVGLMLGEPWLYTEKSRLALKQAPLWQDGRLWIDKASLDVILGYLAPELQKPEPASLEEIAALPKPKATPALVDASPVLLIEPTPFLAPKPTPLTQGILRRIVIDPGHGGRDPGASGFGTSEKDVCLDIALKLARLIQEREPDIEVSLTRNSDFFVTLRQRTIIANELDADLFISIHNNASRNRKGRGSQVFFFDSRTSDRAAADLAKRENEDANWLEILMTDLAKSTVREQSIMLAQKVQDELLQTLRLPKRRLSYAPFYVLARTMMPAILVEVAFISNPSEARLLGSSDFRQEVAEGLFEGIRRYKIALK